MDVVAGILIAFGGISLVAALIVGLSEERHDSVLRLVLVLFGMSILGFLLIVFGPHFSSLAKP